MSGIATAIYSIRNYGKVGKGDVGRLPAAFAQTANSASQAVTDIMDKVDDLGRWADTGKTIGDRAARVSKLASKVTNPLLVGAAAFRVANDEDKKSALIEESAAMAGMFGAERMYKIVRNTVKQGKGDILKSTESKILSKIPGLKHFDKLTSKLDVATLGEKGLGKKLGALGEKISKLSPGKQKGVFIAAELGLVATSILSYNLFKKLGQKITGRDKETKNEEISPNDTGEKPAFTTLTAKRT